MSQQGIYAGPIDSSPNRDREEIACTVNEAFKLWVIEFNVRAIGKGCAIVKAHKPEDASQILKTSGMYNGNPESYLITKIQEVVVPPCCGLMAEEVITYEEYR